MNYKYSKYPAGQHDVPVGDPDIQPVEQEEDDYEPCQEHHCAAHIYKPIATN